MTNNSPSLLQDIWYYALPGNRLKPGEIVAKTLLNQPVLFGRTRTGQVFALQDICPHRAIPLSCGRFDGKTVECCYHGWQFDASGQCVEIPSLRDDQQATLSRFRVKSYQVEEIQGNIWIYMPASDRPSSPHSTIPILTGFHKEQSAQAAVTMRFPCHIDHVVFGLLDMAHVRFIHRSWWWRSKPSNPALFKDGRGFTPSTYGFSRCRHSLTQQNFFYRLMGSKPEVEREFRLPGIRIEQFTTKQHIVSTMTTATPISDSETEVTALFYTTLPWFTALKPILVPFIKTFLNQDREAVVKQQIGLQYNPPLRLVKDADTQVQWYHQLKAEYARATAENRPFVNPVKPQTLNWR